MREFIKEQMVRLAKKLSEPPVAIMSQEEYEALPDHHRVLLVCNVLGCGSVVCSHGMLCLDHHLGRKPIVQWSPPAKE